MQVKYTCNMDGMWLGYGFCPSSKAWPQQSFFDRSGAAVDFFFPRNFHPQAV